MSYAIIIRNYLHSPTFFNCIDQVSLSHKIISFHYASTIYTAVITQTTDHYTSVLHIHDSISINHKFYLYEGLFPIFIFCFTQSYPLTHLITSKRPLFLFHHIKFELWDLPIDFLPIVSRFLFATFFISNHDNSSFITSAISSMSELCYQNHKLSSFSYFFTVALPKFHNLTR